MQVGEDALLARERLELQHIDFEFCLQCLLQLHRSLSRTRAIVTLFLDSRHQLVASVPVIFFDFQKTGSAPYGHSHVLRRDDRDLQLAPEVLHELVLLFLEKRIRVPGPDDGQTPKFVVEVHAFEDDLDIGGRDVQRKVAVTQMGDGALDFVIHQLPKGVSALAIGRGSAADVAAAVADAAAAIFEVEGHIVQRFTEQVHLEQVHATVVDLVDNHRNTGEKSMRMWAGAKAKQAKGFL